MRNPTLATPAVTHTHKHTQGTHTNMKKENNNNAETSDNTPNTPMKATTAKHVHAQAASDPRSHVSTWYDPKYISLPLHHQDLKPQAHNVLSPFCQFSLAQLNSSRGASGRYFKPSPCSLTKRYPLQKANGSGSLEPHQYPVSKPGPAFLHTSRNSVQAMRLELSLP